jgi:dephospho-CoA kinase
MFERCVVCGKVEIETVCLGCGKSCHFDCIDDRGFCLICCDSIVLHEEEVLELEQSGMV